MHILPKERFLCKIELRIDGNDYTVNKILFICLFSTCELVRLFQVNIKRRDHEIKVGGGGLQ